MLLAYSGSPVLPEDQPCDPIHSLDFGYISFSGAPLSDAGNLLVDLSERLKLYSPE